MNRFYQKTRLIIVIIFTVGVLTIYTAALYKIQIYDAAAATDASLEPVTTEYASVIHAKRGDILDRNGNLLVSSRPSFDVMLSRSALLNSGDANNTIREVIHLTTAAGVKYNDAFPVTQGAPFTYVYDMRTEQRTRLDKYLEYFKLDPDISASELIIWLKAHYKIPYTMGIVDTRLIIGVRYELEVRLLVNVAPYVFAQDVPDSLVAQITERSLPGVMVERNSVREYHTSLAAHLLGFMGLMSAAETEYYTALGYPLDATVGKSGAEKGFESYLHGTDGKSVTRIAENGAFIDTVITQEPVPGQNVYLSIDIGLQETSERALADYITTINAERTESQRSTGGAVVVIDVKNSEVLALASNPTYDTSVSGASLLGDTTGRLFNRATQGQYNPGSTFKPVTALAGLRAGVITRWSTISDGGTFTKYDTDAAGHFAPKCWIYSATGYGHGELDVVGAIQNSCNVFFYTVGDMVGNTALAQAARDFGFGSPTGLEIDEKPGVVATDEYKRSVTNGVGWRAADTVYAAIGQGYSLFTPVQIANYCATIANGGTLNKLSLMHAVKSSDYAQTAIAHTPEVVSVIPETDYVTILQQGMRAMVTGGSAYNKFGTYPVKVAAKTGTVQTAQEIDNGLFICYAPADDPQIAIAVVVEKGGSGAAIMDIAKAVLDRYFESGTSYGVVPENALIP